MLRSLKDLEHYDVSATDGDVGRVVNFLLDDEHWAIRYLVVDTGTFFRSLRILVSPISFREADWLTHRFHLALTMASIKSSPSVDVDKPVCRQHEYDQALHYDYPLYWGSFGLWGQGPTPGLLAAGARLETPASHSRPNDVHLRSANEILRYHVHASDGDVGHVDDFIIDDETWEVRYLVIQTGHLWFGKKVLVSPGWADRISWESRAVYVDVKREAIRKCPTWDASMPINREYETRLYDYYGRPAYWETFQPRVKAPAPTRPDLDDF
jgi:sporulation protein YlmC with PRC-barrel domain